LAFLVKKYTIWQPCSAVPLSTDCFNFIVAHHLPDTCPIIHFCSIEKMVSKNCQHFDRQSIAKQEIKNDLILYIKQFFRNLVNKKIVAHHITGVDQCG
jgi:hypothetical protein